MLTHIADWTGETANSGRIKTHMNVALKTHFANPTTRDSLTAGAMRDSTVQLKGVVNSIDTAMMASFVAMPGDRTEDDQPIYYLALIQCDSEEMIRSVYLSGTTGTFCFEQPERGTQPTGWHYVVRPPIAQYQYSGNLVMSITRDKQDERILPSYEFPQLIMTQQEIWAYPDTSDLSPRRLINCANLITSLGPDADKIRRYVCALDLREKEKPHNLFANMSKHPVIEDILAELSPSQLGAFQHVKDSKHDIVLIQGVKDPPTPGRRHILLNSCKYYWSLTIHRLLVLPAIPPLIILQLFSSKSVQN